MPNKVRLSKSLLTRTDITSHVEVSAKALKEVRQKRSEMIASLGNQLGQSELYIFRLEKGRVSKAQSQLVTKIADILKVPVRFL